jgi:DNA modification methylase
MDRPKRISVEYVDIPRLREWDRNPRVMSEDELDALKKNIQHFGIVDPIVVNKDNLVIGGHQRIKAAKALGMKRVPVVRLNLTSQEVKVLNLALNRISGSWDVQKLAPILQELESIPEIDLTGFTPTEITEIVAAIPILDGFSERENQIPEPPPNPITRLGDLWKLDNHHLLCADVTKQESWRRLLNEKEAALVIADPPYGVNYELSKKFVLNPITGQPIPHKSWGPIQNDQDRQTAINSLEHIFNHLTCDGVAYILCGSRLQVDVATWLDEHRIYRSTFLVWDKGRQVISWERYHPEHENIIYCGPGAHPTGNASRWFGPRNETTVWRITPPNGSDRVHPTQKPVELYERAITNSTSRKDVVVDPFAGSGTCLIAAEKTKRSAYCIELDPNACDIAVKRWETFTGRKANRIG